MCYVILCCQSMTTFRFIPNLRAISNDRIYFDMVLPNYRSQVQGSNIIQIDFACILFGATFSLFSVFPWNTSISGWHRALSLVIKCLSIAAYGLKYFGFCIEPISYEVCLIFNNLSRHFLIWSMIKINTGFGTIIFLFDSSQQEFELPSSAQAFRLLQHQLGKPNSALIPLTALFRHPDQNRSIPKVFRTRLWECNYNQMPL